jgi:NAD(P)-dependent dehydrogenase (short-subunit alcohol dehydrogenase family)
VTTGKLQGPKLEGKVAIVTGAALGMGNAVARRFTAEGANVVVADIREAEGKALANELGRRRSSRRTTSATREAGARWSTPRRPRSAASTC